MTNLDDFILHQQYERDNRPLNEDKIWLLFDSSEKLIYSNREKETVERYEDPGDILGWIWEDDYSRDEKKMFKLLNL